MDKRKQVEDYVIQIMDTVDPSGSNTDRYKKHFSSLSDKEFDQWMKDIRDKKEQLYVYAPPLKNKISTNTAVALNKLTKTEVFQRLRLYDESTGRFFLTPNKYFVVPMSVRRVKQYLMHKLSVPRSDKKTDLLTGQVIKPDKGSSVSLIEMQTILDKGLDKVVIEFIKVRGGDLHAYNEFTSKIQENGEVALDDMDLASSQPRSTAVANVFLKSMHIDNNF